MKLLKKWTLEMKKSHFLVLVLVKGVRFPEADFQVVMEVGIKILRDLTSDFIDKGVTA